MPQRRVDQEINSLKKYTKMFK